MLSTLPPDTVSKIKQAIVDGERQVDIAARLCISQATVSNTKKGRKYTDIPWPNGSVGSYEQAYGEGPAGDDSLSEWSEYARAYMGWPAMAQEKMLIAVNERRESAGIYPLPDMSIEWEVYMNSGAVDDADPAEDEERRKKAMRAEDGRRASIFREFQNIVSARLDQRSDERIEAIMNLPLRPSHESDESANSDVSANSVAPTHIDPTEYNTVELIKIVHSDPLNPLLSAAIRDKDAATIEAITIVYNAIPTTHWRRTYVQKSVADTALLVSNSPKALAAGQFKLEQYNKIVQKLNAPTVPNIDADATAD